MLDPVHRLTVLSLPRPPGLPSQRRPFSCAEIPLPFYIPAGIVSFTFLILALLLMACGNMFLNMRRRDELDARIHVRLGALKSPLVPLYAYAAAFGCLGISWATYVAVFQRTFNAVDFQRVMSAVGTWRYRGFYAGFCCTLVAFALLLPAMALLVLHKDEVNRDVARAMNEGGQAVTSTSGIASGAYSDGACCETPTRFEFR